MQFYILSFIGDDRPGFVRDIADVVKRHQGNWIESRMIQLENKFAGLVRVSVNDTEGEQLTRSLEDLAAGKFSLIIQPATPAEDLHRNRYCLDIVGTDRPGIVHETTRALASQDVNVVEISSQVNPAAMSGTPMFACNAIIEVDTGTDLSVLDRRLSEIAQELGLDIQIEAQTSP